MSGPTHSPDWRDRAAYGAIPALGCGALAWEVLRRDPAYRQFAQAQAPTVGTSAHEFGAVNDWGLHFP